MDLKFGSYIYPLIRADAKAITITKIFSSVYADMYILDITLTDKDMSILNAT